MLAYTSVVNGCFVLVTLKFIQSYKSVNKLLRVSFEKNKSGVVVEELVLLGLLFNFFKQVERIAKNITSRRLCSFSD